MLDSVIQHSKILIVDDELANVRLLALILDREGYDHVLMTTDPREVTAIVAREQPNLVLLDLHMPHLTGYEVMELLAPLQPAEAYFPIIVLTADSTPQAKRRALMSGATDFVCKPFDNLEVVQRTGNALQMRHLHLQLLDQNQVLEERVKERTAGMEAAVAQLRIAEFLLRKFLRSTPSLANRLYSPPSAKRSRKPSPCAVHRRRESATWRPQVSCAPAPKVLSSCAPSRITSGEKVAARRRPKPPRRIR